MNTGLGAGVTRALATAKRLEMSEARKGRLRKHCFWEKIRYIENTEESSKKHANEKQDMPTPPSLPSPSVREWCVSTRGSSSPVAQTLKGTPTMRETWVPFLGWQDPLEEGMATHTTPPAWRVPWTEEPAGLQSTGSQSQTR